MQYKGLPDNRRTRFFSRLFRYRVPVISGFIIAALLLIYSASRMDLKEDIMDLLPTHDPVVKKYKTVLTGFNRFDYMVIDVGPESEERIPSKDELTKTADIIVEKMEASGHFVEIQYRWAVDDLASSIDILRTHRASLFTEGDGKELEKRLDVESIRETFRGWKKILTESPAPFLSETFYNDPLALDAFLYRKLEDFKSLGGQVRMDEGRVFSRDMRHILILARPVYPGTDNIHAKKVVDFMDKAVRESEAALSGQVRIAYMGSHRFALNNAEMIKRDIKLTMIIAGASIALLSLLVFRRPFTLTILTMFPAFFGGAFASGMIMLLYPGISAISIGCGAMLMGIVVDFGIHFLYHVDQLSPENTDQTAIIRILDKLSVPIMLTAATTVIAFLTLELSVLPGYRQLGLFAAFGIIGAFLFALLVLPLLIPAAGSARKKPVLNLAGIYPPFFRWAMTRKKSLLFIIFIISISAALGLYRLEFEGDIQKLNAVYPDTKRDWDIVVKSFGETLDSTSVVVEGKDMEEALQRNELLYKNLGELKDQGRIKGSNSISLLLPSEARQAENRQRWLAFWNKERIEKLNRDVELVCAEMRIQPQVVKNALSELPGFVPALDVKAFNTGFLKTIASNQVSVKPQGAMIMTNIQPSDDDQYISIASKVEGSVPGAIITSGRHFMLHIVSLIHKEMTRLGGAALLFVATAMVFYSRKVNVFMKLMLPLFVSLFWTFGMMGWLGIKINMMNSIIVIFIFGVVDDYCVFLYEAWEHAASGNDTHLSHTSGAITISAVTTILGLGSLVFASHPALHSIGATALLGICSGLASVFLLVPILNHDRISNKQAGCDVDL